MCKRAQDVLKNKIKAMGRNYHHFDNIFLSLGTGKIFQYKLTHWQVFF